MNYHRFRNEFEFLAICKGEGEMFELTFLPTVPRWGYGPGVIHLNSCCLRVELNKSSC